LPIGRAGEVPFDLARAETWLRAWKPPALR
jgi:hypothetical protein